MVTRKPVGGYPQPAPSSANATTQKDLPSPPIPGTPIVIAPTPTTPASSPPIPRHAPPAAPPPPPPPPPPEDDDLSAQQANRKQQETRLERPYPASESEDEWDKSDSESSEDEWDLAGDDDDQERKMTPDEHDDKSAIPAPLRISRPSSQEPIDKGKGKESDLPPALRVGPPGGVPSHSPSPKIGAISNESLPRGGPVMEPSNNPWRSVSQSPPRGVDGGHNPFMLKPQNTGEALFGSSQNSSTVWSHGSSPQPGGAIAELPSTNSPTDERRGRPFGAVSELPGVSSPVGKHAPLLPVGSDAAPGFRPVSTSDPFGPIPAEGLVGTQQAWQEQSAHAPPTIPTWPAMRDKSTEPKASPSTSTTPAEGSGTPPVSWPKMRERASAAVASASNSAPTPTSPPEESVTANLLEDFEANGGELAPALPPRRSTEVEEGAPPKPPRPEAGASASSAAHAEVTRSTMESPETAMKKQRNQTYQIKKVRWFDDRIRDMRVSPILIQNANGPCPLLALVNALTLSTPRDQNTGLVEALRTREQVSLGLLLDAVFEELMSGRRGDSAQALPDVTELYSFLIALHTGMNVNPQFTRDDKTPQLRQPGSFEQTKEMRLYGTFSVPLIHGWIPEPDSEAYSAFERSAKTYEDAQNIQFYEEELEAKLGGSGLSIDEQHMFEDLVSVKQFLQTWPTQLTDYGLNILREHLRPGQFAILFRNDHFSTVYKEPRSNSLVTVVTDAGYASHDEIVWESLVDINGMHTEHFSGDFRPVSHNQPVEGNTSGRSTVGGPTVGKRNSSLGGQNVQSMLDVDQGWTQVQGGKKGKRVNKDAGTSAQTSGIIGGSGGSSSAAARTQAATAGASGMTQTEQEDADLALALQLQEEEEDRQRREQSERRNRQLSSQVLDQTTPPTPIRPLIPPRRTGPQFTTNRPQNDGDEAPPPSYEDASKDRRFNPPRDHPASPHAPITPGTSSTAVGGASASSGHGRESSAYASTSGVHGRRTSGSMSTNDLPGMGRGMRRPSGPPLINRIPERPYRQGGRLSGPMSPVGGPNSREEKCTVM